eukprot:Seg6255.3 transcript_id=Seg6255.3/GoldUCD/mRNA.D3Y31 product="5-hydroxyisourate hydrolase" protein_id=Seg6255.3/GoldUCD/D3Y31
MANLKLATLLLVALAIVFIDAAGNPVTTHVLDVSKGLPGNNLRIQFYQLRKDKKWNLLRDGYTNNDGRLGNLITQEKFTPGIYKMVFNLAEYFKKEGKDYFHPKAEVVFKIKDPKQHYHVPLLVTPYSYTTYRGS